MIIVRNDDSDFVTNNIVGFGISAHADLDYDREIPEKPIGFTADFSTHPALQEEDNG